VTLNFCLQLARLITFTALLCLSALGAEHAVEGSMELKCIPPAVLAINLTPAISTTLSLQVWIYPRIEKHKLLAADATLCAAAGKCEHPKAHIQFDRFNLRKGALGHYYLEFEDGRTSNSSFDVTRRKQPSPFLCE
jgi:hypothetical protein